MSHIPVALRRAVHERAEGACEYCRFPEALAFVAHEVDHVIARKHGGATELNNLALSCILCNKYKGTDLASLDPDTGQLVALYNPRRERWVEHFELAEATIAPLSPEGRATARLLRLEHPDRRAERLLAFAAGLLRPPE
jgi:5-methylcytosine-specific restriction endonuclease McrA